MISNEYSVYDAASATYGPKTLARTHAEALRSFQQAIDNEDHQFSRHAKDYTLFYVGTWDDQTGNTASETNIGLGNALELKAIGEASAPAPQDFRDLASATRTTIEQLRGIQGGE